MAETDISGRPDEHVRQASRVEALPGRARVRRVLPHDLGPERDEPVEPFVEPVEHEPLEPLVAVRTLAAKVLERQVTPDDAAREEHRPARAVALLEHDRLGPELAGARSSAQAGHPSSGDDHRTSLGQRERRLVLDVLDLDALGPPDEHRVRVRRVHDVRDLEPELARLGDVVVGRVDLDREVVQQRLLGIARLALVELDERAARLDPRRAGRPGLGGGEPQPEVGLGGLLRRLRPERDVVDVVLDVGRRLDEADPQPLVDVEVELALARTVDLDPVQLGLRLLVARDPQRDVLERTRARAGPRRANSVSFPWRACDPTRVNASVRSITCMPTRSVRTSAMASRSATQRATWSSVSGLTRPA